MLAEDFLSGESVMGITAWADGFVAVGYRDAGISRCRTFEDGLVWSSPNGVSWEVAATLSGVRLERVIAFDGALLAFGVSGVDCSKDGNARVWKSVDGTEWQVMGERLGSNVAHWNHVVALEGRIVGFIGDYRYGDSVWASDDGVRWRQVIDAPTAISSATGFGSQIFGFGPNVLGLGLEAWYSRDYGGSWEQGHVDTDYRLFPTVLDAADGELGFSRACCGLPMTEVGVDLWTHDGITWSPSEFVHAMPADWALHLPGGFYVTINRDGAGTEVSADGNSWFSGPSSPGLGGAEYRIPGPSAVGTRGIVIAARDILAEGVREPLWYAPIDAFDPLYWTNPATPAAEPEYGQPYPLQINTHCGSSSMRVDFAGGAWVPTSLPSGGLGYNTDEGTISLIDSEHAIYTSSQGATVPYQRAHPAPEPFICY